MQSIFFVEAPFQLLSAYEAIGDYELDDYLIFVRFSKDFNNDQQLKRTAEVLFRDDTRIRFFTVSTKKIGLNDYFNVAYYFLFCLVTQYKYKHVFIGNLESKFLSLLLKTIYGNKVTLLDDGIKSLLFQKNFNEKYFYNLYTMIDDLVPIGSQIITHNRFKKLQALIKQTNSSSDVFFIGSKVSEVGIILDEEYIDLMRKISCHYKDRNILYFSHRGERKDKLDAINNIHNLNVIQLDYPIELYPLFENVLPTQIASFYSAALISMKKLYKEVGVTSFSINNVTPEYQELVARAYKYIDKHMDVIDLNVE